MIVVEDYNPEWPVMFQGLKEILSRHLGDLSVAIEHVGSTSVSGLAAKPILDLDVVIDSNERLREMIVRLAELGYEHEGDLGVKGREAFARMDKTVPFNLMMDVKPEHHLYVCSQNSKELERHLLFRNILRKHPVLIEEYSLLKRNLAEKFGEDRQGYTKGKAEFVESVLRSHRE